MKKFIIIAVGMFSLPTLPLAQSRFEADEHRPIAQLDASAIPPTPLFLKTATASPSAVTLNGIANLNYRCALLTIQTLGQPKVSVVLKEGESHAAVQVLQINITNARVLVRIGDRTQLLSLTSLTPPVTSVPDAEHAPLPTIASEEAGER